MADKLIVGTGLDLNISNPEELEIFNLLNARFMPSYGKCNPQIVKKNDEEVSELNQRIDKFKTSKSFEEFQVLIKKYAVCPSADTKANLKNVILNEHAFKNDEIQVLINSEVKEASYNIFKDILTDGKQINYCEAICRIGEVYGEKFRLLEGFRKFDEIGKIPEISEGDHLHQYRDERINITGMANIFNAMTNNDFMGMFSTIGQCVQIVSFLKRYLLEDKAVADQHATETIIADIFNKSAELSKEPEAIFRKIVQELFQSTPLVNFSFYVYQNNGLDRDKYEILKHSNIYHEFKKRINKKTVEIVEEKVIARLFKKEGYAYDKQDIGVLLYFEKLEGIRGIVVELMNEADELSIDKLSTLFSFPDIIRFSAHIKEGGIVESDNGLIVTGFRIAGNEPIDIPFGNVTSQIVNTTEIIFIIKTEAEKRGMIVDGVLLTKKVIEHSSEQLVGGDNANSSASTEKTIKECTIKDEFYNLLKESIPNRFGNMDPFKFEEFICKLFIDMGYQAQTTPKTGDYGADVIIQKGNVKTAVQVKRNDPKNLVGVQQINQVVGAKDYYKCTNALIITTSSLTSQGKNLCDSTQTGYWGWEMLYEKIKKTYLGGQDIYEYCKSNNLATDSKHEIVSSGHYQFILEKNIVKSMVVTTSDSGKSTGVKYIFTVNIKNVSSERDCLFISGIIIFDVLGNQFALNGFFEDSFRDGDVYPYASVKLKFSVSEERIEELSNLKSILIKYAEKCYEDASTGQKMGQQREIGIPFDIDTYNLEDKTQPQKSGCFIATAAYGSDMAMDVVFLKNYRDKYLLSSYFGKHFVQFYYKVSPRVASFIYNKETLKFLTRKILKLVIMCIKNKG